MLNKRSGNDVWKNLYDFPLIETDSLLNKKELEKNPRFNELVRGDTYQIKEISDHIIHKLSHQHIHTRFFQIKLGFKELFHPEIFVQTPINKIHTYPMPKLMENYLNSITENLN